MRIAYCLYVAGALLISVGVTMLFPLGWALWYQDDGLRPLLHAMLVSLGMGGVLSLAFRKWSGQTLNHREGMVIVALSWLCVCLVGSLPYWFANTFPLWTDCVFESVSGFTTTGATALRDIEIVPRSLLMWRALTHWLGGMGIIVMSLAILPFLGVGGMQLYRAEVPGPAPDKLRPRIRDTATVLWKVYVLFTCLLCILLMAGGMDLFDAICHAFSTTASGGFSTKNASMAHFESPYIQWVTIVFMFMAGASFALHYRMLTGDIRCFWRNAEFRFYLGLILLCSLIIAISLYGTDYDSVEEAVRHALFQVVSVCTTTGFATADYEMWLPLPQALILLLMFVGGCAGSTAGGIKSMRVLLLLRQGYHELFRLVHPRAVRHVKLGGRSVPIEVLSGIQGFFILYLTLFVVSGILLSACGLDILTAFSAAASGLGNVGPAFGTVGPVENFAHVPVAAKWVLTWCMLLGRLEIYAIIILFIPEFWRK